MKKMDDDILISTIEELKKLSQEEAKQYIEQIKKTSDTLNKFKELNQHNMDYVYKRLIKKYRDMTLADIISFFLLDFISPHPCLIPCNTKEKLLWPLGIRPAFKLCKKLPDVKRNTFYKHLNYGTDDGIFIKATIQRGKSDYKTMFTITDKLAESIYNWAQYPTQV